MHPSTVHRVVSLLEAENLVRRDPESERYSLGLDFLRIAWQTGARNALVQIALPVLERLRDETGETANLGVYDAGRRAMMLVASAESRHAIRNVRPLFTWMPVHGGATGRALLAWADDADREGVLAGRLEAVTDATLTDPPALARNLAGVRRKGYALSRGERVPGGVGIAAPVLASGRLAGVVGITFPEQRYARAAVPELAARVIAAAAAVAAQLG